jgi:hypothetical protein
MFKLKTKGQLQQQFEHRGSKWYPLIYVKQKVRVFYETYCVGVFTFISSSLSSEAAPLHRNPQPSA